MSLVNEGALDDAGVEALAERLGIGARHLLRLFKKHVGASPTQVAQTARVQRAKRMIDNTHLPMTAIALAAGFGSLRRFNTVFAAVYKRPPTALRRTSHAPMASAAWGEIFPVVHQFEFVGVLLARAAFDAFGSHALPIAASAAFALVATVLVILTPVFCQKPCAPVALTT